MARLLFDQNLSHRLVAALSDLFPQSLHVRDVGLSRADDLTVWNYARNAGLAIISKDADFNQMSFVYGPPPKVIWLRVGNCTTEQASILVRSRAETITDFIDAADEALFIVDADV